MQPEIIRISKLAVVNGQQEQESDTFLRPAFWSKTFSEIREEAGPYILLTWIQKGMPLLASKLHIQYKVTVKVDKAYFLKPWNLFHRHNCQQDQEVNSSLVSTQIVLQKTRLCTDFPFQLVSQLLLFWQLSLLCFLSYHHTAGEGWAIEVTY